MNNKSNEGSLMLLRRGIRTTNFCEATREDPFNNVKDSIIKNIDLLSDNINNNKFDCDLYDEILTKINKLDICNEIVIKNREKYSYIFNEELNSRINFIKEKRNILSSLIIKKDILHFKQESINVIQVKYDNNTINKIEKLKDLAVTSNIKDNISYNVKSIIRSIKLVNKNIENEENSCEATLEGSGILEIK
jgi:hypothetical protein